MSNVTSDCFNKNCFDLALKEGEEFLGTFAKGVSCFVTTAFDGAKRVVSQTEGLEKLLSVVKSILDLIAIQMGDAAHECIEGISETIEAFQDIVCGTKWFKSGDDICKKSFSKTFKTFDNFVESVKRVCTYALSILGFDKLLTNWGAATLALSAIKIGGTPLRSIPILIISTCEVWLSGRTLHKTWNHDFKHHVIEVSELNKGLRKRKGRFSVALSKKEKAFLIESLKEKVEARAERINAKIQKKKAELAKDGIAEELSEIVKTRKKRLKLGLEMTQNETKNGLPTFDEYFELKYKAEVLKLALAKTDKTGELYALGRMDAAAYIAFKKAQLSTARENTHIKRTKAWLSMAGSALKVVSTALGVMTAYFTLKGFLELFLGKDLEKWIDSSMKALRTTLSSISLGSGVFKFVSFIYNDYNRSLKPKMKPSEFKAQIA